MQNPSFEDGWYTRIDDNQEPKDWTLKYESPGFQLIAPKAGDGDAIQDVRCIPECVHKLNSQLPEDEQLGGDDALILDGVATFKLFGNSSFRATLQQSFSVKAGNKCSLTVPVQVHGHLNPDTGEPYNIDTGAAYWRVSIDGQSSDWMTFNRNFNDRQWASYTHQFSTFFGDIYILIEFECHTLGGVDFFIDNLQFSTEGGDPISECRGKPRVQYERVYNLLPKSATIEQEKYIVELVHETRETVGYSADDAGIGDLDDRLIKVWWFDDDSWESEYAVNDFFETYYPGTFYTYEYAYDPDPEPPPIDPPPGGEPDPIEHYSGNFVGLQHLYAKENWLDYVRDARPVVTKFLEVSNAIEGKQAQPQMLTVWRKFVDNYDTGQMLNDGRDGAIRLLNIFTTDIDAYSKSQGVSVDFILSQVDVIESLNETIPSNNATVIEMAVLFEGYFSDELHKRYGNKVKAGLLNVAVGNPLESEVWMLLPCAKLSHVFGDPLGYHGYWAANENSTYLWDGWEWHAGRWEEWDKVFNDHGYYPTYYLGECGIVYSPDGQWLNPVGGWKSCGDFLNYIAQIKVFNGLITEWNSKHQGRCYGGTLFVYGAWEWDSFDFNPGDLALLTEEMKVYG